MSYIHACLHCPKIGKRDYLSGKSLFDNPYVYGTFYARTWVDGWLKAWLDRA